MKKNKVKDMTADSIMQQLSKSNYPHLFVINDKENVQFSLKDPVECTECLFALLLKLESKGDMQLLNTISSVLIAYCKGNSDFKDWFIDILNNETVGSSSTMKVVSNNLDNNDGKQ